MSNSESSYASPGFTLGLNDGTLGLLIAAIVLYTSVLWTANGLNVARTDFSLSYVGAKIVHTGTGEQLYNLELQRELRNSLFSRPVPLFFEHPPFEAWLLSPLAAHSFRTAYRVWGLLNATVWLVLIVVLRRYLPWPHESLGYILFWLLFVPLGVALYQGQSSLLVLASFAVAFLLLKREKYFSAGIALGFGLLKFQFVLPFALIFLFRRKWRFLGGFALCTSALMLISIAVMGWTGVIGYARFLFAIGAHPENVSLGSGVDMPTIHGFVFALTGGRLSGLALNVVAAALSIALLAWIASRWERAEDNSSFDLTFAAAVAVALLSGSHMFTHDFAPLVIPLFLVAAQLSQRKSQSTNYVTCLALRFTLVLFWMFPIYFLLVKWHCLFLMAPVLLVFVWAAMKQTEGLELSRVGEAIAAR